MRFLCCVLFAASLTGAEGFSGRLTLTLADALIQIPDRPADAGNLKDLNVVATARDGAWEEVWGYALRFDKSQHRGVVRSIERDGDRLRIDLAMLIVGDAWIPGTAATYTLELRIEDGAVDGTYTGRCAYGPDGPVEVSGAVGGHLAPPPTPVDGFVPFAADEFPRLLLRERDLPRLRERLATPFGQAVAARMKRSSNPICLGLMYQLTGDGSFARRAVEPVRKKMAETGGGPFAIGRVWGYRAEYVAYAYDLCREAWDDDFNREVEAWIDWIAPRCIDRPWSLSSAVNITPGSNYMVVIWGGAGLAAITRIGAPGPAPEAPREDFAEAGAIVPPADWNPAEGVPVVGFANRTMPRPWLWAGGWPTAEMGNADPLADLGGPERAHAAIAPGVAIAAGDREAAFATVPDEGYYHDGSGRFTEGHALDFATLFVPEGGKKADSYFRTGYFFTALEVAESRPVRLIAPSNNAAAVDALWVSGRRLEHGDLCTLEPGVHPVLMRARSIDLIPNPWGAMLCEPRFEVLEPERLEQLAAGRAIELAVREELHARDLADWEASGGGDPERLQLARRGARWNALNCQGSMGDGGFQAEGEGYTLECHRPLIGYCVAHRHAFGTELNGRPDASHFAPRYVATTVWTGEESKGRPEFRNLTWGGGGGTIQADYLGRCFPLCPDEWKPALLWFWHRRMGVDDGADPQARAIAAVDGWRADANLAYAFLHYPLGMEAENPEGIVPGFWAADGKGFYSFRNAFEGADDVVAQFYAKAGEGAGWNAAEAGGFQIQGLGHTWAAKARHDRGGSRHFENVVMLPDDDTHGSARCTVIDRRGDPASGSGAVSVDLDPVYEVGRPREDNPKKKDWIDGGIAGWRAFAASYLPDATGVPAAFAVVDRVEGGGRKVWTMHVPGFDDAEVAVEGRRFTIRKGGSSLVGTVVSPADARIEAGEEGGVEAGVGPGRKNRKGKTEFTFRGIRIAGPEGDEGDFFVVMTLQRDEAPDVTIDGEGLTATARIGELVFRVDPDARRIDTRR